MRRLAGGLLAALGLGLACGQQAPATPLPPNELVFVGRPGGGHLVVEARDGSTVGELPAGLLAARLNEGGDVGEAYLVGPESGLARLRIGHPIALQKLADMAGADQVALVPAPGLTSFVGPKTVLVVRRGGVLSGFQAGSPIWTSQSAAAAALAWTGDVAEVRRAGGTWAALAPETGALSDEHGACSPGPVAAGWYLCGSTLEGPGGARLDSPAGRPVYALRPLRSSDLVLAFGDGSYYRLAASGRVLAHASPTLTPAGPPALAPDGSRLYWPEGGVTAQVAVAAGERRTLPVAASALGVSRDGSFLYLLGEGGLRLYSTAAGRVVRTYAGVSGDSIELIAGG